MSEFYQVARTVRLRPRPTAAPGVPRSMLTDGRPWESLTPGVELVRGGHVRVGGRDVGLDPTSWYIGELLGQSSPGFWSVYLGDCVDNIELQSHRLTRILYDIDEPGVFWGGSLCQSYQLSSRLQQMFVCRLAAFESGLDLSVVTHPEGFEDDAWLDDLDDAAFRAEMEKRGIPLSS